MAYHEVGETINVGTDALDTACSVVSATATITGVPPTICGFGMVCVRGTRAICGMALEIIASCDCAVPGTEASTFSFALSVGIMWNAAGRSAAAQYAQGPCIDGAPNHRPEMSTKWMPLDVTRKMLPLVLETNSRPLLPRASHLGAPSVTMTSAGCVETTMLGTDVASDATGMAGVAGAGAEPAVAAAAGVGAGAAAPASKFTAGCVVAHVAAAARSAFPAVSPTVHGPASVFAVIHPSAIFNHHARALSRARSICVLITRSSFVPGISCSAGFPCTNTKTVGTEAMVIAGGALRSGAACTRGAVAMVGTAASKRSSETITDRAPPLACIAACMAASAAGSSGRETPVTVRRVNSTMRVIRLTSVDAVNENVP